MTARADRWLEVADLFTLRLAAVSHDQWELPTPGEDGDVRARGEHAVAYQWGYLAALGEADGIDPSLGDDPSAGWATVRSALKVAYTNPETLARTFDFVTPTVAGTVADQIIVPTHDLLIHTWDLSRAIGADESLPAATCEELLGIIEPIEDMIRIPEWYGPALDAPVNARPQTKLLRFTGRDG